MSRAISLLPQYVFMAWCLVTHRDNFTQWHMPYDIYVGSIPSKDVGSLRHHVQNALQCALPAIRSTEPWSGSLDSILCRGLEGVEIYLPYPPPPNAFLTWQPRITANAFATARKRQCSNQADGFTQSTKIRMVRRGCILDRTGLESAQRVVTGVNNLHTQVSAFLYHYS